MRATLRITLQDSFLSRLAIDIGGTHLRYELIGETEVCGNMSSRDSELAHFIGTMIEKYSDIDAVAISFAGQVHDGTILSAPNIETEIVDIQAHFESKYGIRIRIENDLNCAALAESVYWGEENLVALYSGTGLGSGIIEKGEIVYGSRGLAGEIGHIPYREAPFACGCGKHNCIELYASGSGIEKWMAHLDCKEPVDLDRLFRSGSESCRSIAEKYIDALLYAAATLVTLCNPKIVVLGGGVIRHNPFVLESLNARLGDFALHAAMEDLRLEASHIENASLEGAKLLLDTM